MIVLDTQVLVWARERPEKLSQKALSAMRRARASGGVGISAFTLWELARLVRMGRLQAPGPMEVSVERMAEGTTILPITAGIAALGVQFGEAYPADPADRIIGATAVFHQTYLVTADERIRNSGLVSTIW